MTNEAATQDPNRTPPPEMAVGAGTDRELSADLILGMQDTVRERVDVPEWNGHCYVRGLTAQERDAWERSLFEMKGKKAVPKDKNVRARLVVMCAVSSSGTPMFKPEQADQLGQKNGAAVDRLFAVAQRLCGITDEEVEALEGE